MAFEWGAINKAKPRPKLIVKVRTVKPKTRKQALDEMLQPITWSWSSSIGYRTQLVTSRRQQVFTILPFLTPAERKRATQWLKDEAHDSLWD